ncbi:hypothetical protein H310_03454 [Aphanomyces invadans]|uniref:Uncharacterized protein n=1 Tax=Aphanomyces invadans TaxID=157072 RepID=A0A024UHT1_9STRA|nr:hypothetical protein H310_03454 [Aphanomyces invadans]ETW05770.1 hypothetical protein H310_03454 [Aphanomyces invadans]|eukprot:XP_008865547.1 hypothetical protein H310_03454 [Aphanomyces invadans]
MATHHVNDGCCAEHHGLDDYDIHGDDPTLSACCMKDMKEQAEYVRVHTILQAHDVAQHRLAHRQQGIPTTTSTYAPPPHPSIAMTSTSIEANRSDDSDLDEFDYLLDDEDAVTNRRREVEAKSKLQAQGLGIVWGDKEFAEFYTRLKGYLSDDLAKHKQNRPTIVAWRSTDHDATAVLNAALIACAERFLGTCVYAVSNACSTHVQALCGRHTIQKSSDAVAVVALNNHGQYIAHKTIAALDDATWEFDFVPWLTNCNVLREKFEPTTREAVAAVADEDDSEPAVEKGYDCGRDKCRLRHGYYHEHVGPSEASKREMSEWRR